MIVLTGMSKTTRLLQLAHESYAYIVCADAQRRDQLWRRIRSLGLSCPQPITWDEFVKGQYFSRGINEFMIDDLDDCIQKMTAVPIRVVTLSDE